MTRGKRPISPPPGKRPLHNKWVFVKKKNSEGEVERYEGRLVVCGNEQRYGIDYDKTFSEVMDTGTCHVMGALPLKWDVELIHDDVPNAYVKAESEEGFELFMVQPQGRKNTPGKVLKLKKSLYGLKQVGRMWNHLLNSKLLNVGFTQSVVERCV